MKGRTRDIRLILAALVLFTAIAAGYLFYEIKERVANDFAVWHTADLIIAYLKTHDDRWPRSWAELKTVQIEDPAGFIGAKAEAGGYSAFLESLERRVAVDFTVETSELLKAELGSNGPPFRVVYLRNGKSAYYIDAEPNWLIFNYLRSNKRHHDI